MKVECNNHKFVKIYYRKYKDKHWASWMHAEGMFICNICEKIVSVREYF